MAQDATWNGVSDTGGLFSAAQAAMPSEFNPNLAMYGGNWQTANQNFQGLGQQGQDLSQNMGNAASAANRSMIANSAGDYNTAATANRNLGGNIGAYQGAGNAAQQNLGNAANAINTSAGANAQYGQTLGQAGAANAAQLGQQYGNTRLAAMSGPSNLGMQNQVQAIQGLQNFAGQQAPTSQAQIQLQQGNQQNMANAMALASSGRGGGANAAAQMQGLAQAGAANAQNNLSMALLRAQEEQNWRNQQMQALGASAQVGANLQGQSLAQTQQNLAIGQAQANTALAAGQLQNQYLQTGQGSQQLGLNYQQLAAQQQGQALAGQQAGVNANLNYQQLAAQQQGLQNQNSMAALGYANANAQLGTQLQYQGALQGGQFEQGFAGMQQQQLANQAQNTMQGYTAQMGAAQNTAIANAQMQTQMNPSGAILSGGGALLGML